jgi:CubicO group peptidase (beta-lactamase class C family)
MAPETVPWARAVAIVEMLLAPSLALAQPAGLARTRRLDSLIMATRQRVGAPGLSVAIASDGRIRYSRSFGLADVENDVPATAGTEYRTASVAKPFTAAAVLQLVEAGKVALDSSIRAYVRGLPTAYDRVTLLDLLRHTSGVRHYRDEAEFVTTRHCDSLYDALAIFAADPLEHAPGEKITYSSYGYDLLGLAVEHASGRRYADYEQSAVFDRAGMRHTVLDDPRIIPHRARGYTRTKGGELRNAPAVDLSCRVPAGGFVSTAEDLARFAIALDTGALLDAHWRAEMTRSHLTPDMIARTLAGLQVPPGFRPPGMGFGWAIEPDGSAAYHGGNQPGFTSMLYYLPSRHLSVSIMTNLDDVGDELTELARRLAALVPPGTTYTR